LRRDLTPTRFARKSDVSDLCVINAPISGKPDIDAQTDLPLSGGGKEETYAAATRATKWSSWRLSAAPMRAM
jgi:hypothetical protein